jgi:hypothetical protein
LALACRILTLGVRPALEFRAWIDELYQKRVETHAKPEDISFRHISEPLPAHDVLDILSAIFEVEVSEFSRRRHGSPLRAVAAKLLLRYAGLTQRDVASLLSIGRGSAVCNQLKALPEKVAKDRRLRRRLNEAEAALDESKNGRRAHYKVSTILI